MSLRVGVNLLFLRPGGVGGAEVYCRECLSRWVTRSEVDVVVFTNELAAEVVRDWGPSAVVTVMGSRYSQLKRLRAENLGLIGALRMHPVDVLFSPANISPVFLPRRIPQVVTVHDLQHLWYPENFPLPKLAGRLLLGRLSIARARRIITVSEFTRQDVLERFDSPADSVVTVHEGVDRTEIPGRDEARRVCEKLGLPSRYLFYPATANSHKNHVGLVEAFAHMIRRGEVDTDVWLVFCGRQQAAWPAVEHRSRQLGIEHRIRHLGYLQRPRMLAVLRGATIMAFPSRFEGFGLPLLEAMACETPVVASRRASIPEVAGDAAVLLPPDHPEAWARTMIRLMNDEAARRDLIERGRRNLKRFSWEKCARQTLEVLRDAAR